MSMDKFPPKVCLSSQNKVRLIWVELSFLSLVTGSVWKGEQMWQYVFLMLRRQPGKSGLVSSGFLLTACALILLSATTQTTLVRGNQIISQNWRPTYDLVALPPQAKIPADSSVP